MREKIRELPICKSVSTRSKSRIFYHQNRSGFRRPDPVTRNPILQMEAFLDISASQFLLTKGHRQKRVFSPVVDSVAEEESEELNEERKKSLKRFDSSTVQDVDDGQNLKEQTIRKTNMALNCSHHRRKVFKAPNSFSYRRLLPHLMEIVNDNSSVSEIELVDTTAEIRPLGVKEKGHEIDMSGVDASVGENIQTTPPDPGIYAEKVDGHGRESTYAKKVLAENQTFKGLPVGSEKSIRDALKWSPNSKCSTNSMSETVLNPCSRLRLSKNPRSFSYRRLLPFLMDISKTDSCTSRNSQQKKPQVVPEEDRHPTPAASSEPDYVNNTTKENSYEKIYSEDLIQTASDGLSPDSSNDLVSSTPESSATNYSSNIDPKSVSSATATDLGMAMGETPRSQSGLAKLQLDPGFKESSSVSEPSSVISYIHSKQCTFAEPRSVEKQNMCLSMGLELPSGNTESMEMVNLKQHAFQIKTSDALVSSGNRSSKGILKRNRRGCRGLCNCLNCASFRLHAERAFEFSRNQLHDAEEVASELMKELATLRLLLEKSVVEKNDCSCHPVLMKQACSRAIEAETMAKERLGEMNNDLSAHCRIPDLVQPKVTFSYNIQ